MDSSENSIIGRERFINSFFIHGIMISKDKWAEIILDWQKKELPKIVPRELEVSYDSDIQRAISIIGPRRAGKTYEMFQIITRILFKAEKSRVLYINFERADLGVLSYADLAVMLEAYYELFPQNKMIRIWLFLDEIQNVSEWEKFVRTCLDENIKVFLSGSSSKLLSKEIATSMRGRNLSYTIYPFSFKEYLLAKKFEIKRYYSSEEASKISHHLEEYLIWGGYPEAVIYPEEKEKALRDIFETAILKDVQERHKVRNITALKIFIKALLTSKEFSINKFYLYLKSQQVKIGKNVLYNYLEYLEDAFFIFALRKFSLSYKKSEQSLPKVYFMDNGLLTINGIDDKGRMMENLVFVELLRRGHNISYYQNQLKEEVDFLITEGKKVKELIQVCSNLDNLITFDRETRILIKASKEFKCNNLLIISRSKEGEEKVKGKKIKFIPLRKWLLTQK